VYIVDFHPLRTVIALAGGDFLRESAKIVDFHPFLPFFLPIFYFFVIPALKPRRLLLEDYLFTAGYSRTGCGQPETISLVLP
jgi:hypothetical protein